ncbi:uncharacterized protein LOC62_06G007922 [Vanrija pseudolonga]|uniref:Uncharacterized protein n=1 Tax=Vanrija pseudolonga TaxID=143232 RepID=A0AAF1BK97_9TREE|nr:hypothetical protein LOC62_06G007922 [Vanrija pseudolonga]
MADKYKAQYETFESSTLADRQTNLTNHDAATALSYLAAKEYEEYTAANGKHGSVSKRDKIIRGIVNPIVDREFTSKQLYFLDKKTVVETTVKNVELAEKVL